MPACTNWHSGALRNPFNFTDFTPQQGKRHNMGGSIPPLCKGPENKQHRHHKHLALQKEIIQSQICTKTSGLTHNSYRSMQMRDHRTRWCWLCWGNTPVLCMLGKDCCWKKVRDAVMLFQLSGLLGTFRVLVIGLHPTAAPGTALFLSRPPSTGHCHVLLIGHSAMDHHEQK